jgi:metal-responsive CopG/Arc/MetJ family transcriptional regulator
MTKSIELRIPDDLAKRIDARVAKVGAKSRNAWLIAALEWAVEQTPKTVTKTERV